MQQGLLSSISI